MLPGFLFVIEVLIAVAAVPLCVLSLVTSRRRRSRQRTFMALAVALIVLALMGVILTLMVGADADDTDYWLALVTPIMTLMLTGLTIWRSNPPAARKHGGGRRVHIPHAIKSR